MTGLADPDRVTKFWQAIDAGLAAGDATFYLAALRLVLPKALELDPPVSVEESFRAYIAHSILADRGEGEGV